MIVALQLVLLAACALLLVARLLGAERGEETQLLRARGASRREIVALAAVEALLLALPALVLAPLLAGPMARLMAARGGLTGIGPRIGEAEHATGGLRLVTEGATGPSGWPRQRSPWAARWPSPPRP